MKSLIASVEDYHHLDALSYRVYADTNVPEVGPSPMNLIKSKKRVADHGEVFTPLAGREDA